MHNIENGSFLFKKQEEGDKAQNITNMFYGATIGFINWSNLGYQMLSINL